MRVKFKNIILKPMLLNFYIENFNSNLLLVIFIKSYLVTLNNFSNALFPLFFF